MKNPYEVLGVSALDSKTTIKAQYRKLCKIYHPDMIGTGDSAKFREINEAWEYINTHADISDVPQYWHHKTLFTVERKSR